MTEKIQLGIEGTAATLTINNPPLNILSVDVLEELGKLLEIIKYDPTIWSVVITGNGKNFSAGADIKEIKKIVFGKNSRADGWVFARLGLEIMGKIYNFPKPIVAFINGDCHGGGLGLALACQKRIAASHAILGFPEVKLGLIPGWGGLEFIRNLKSFSDKNKKEKIIEIVSKGFYLTAQEALELGLVDEIEIIDSDEKPKKLVSRPYSTKAAKYISHSLINRRPTELGQKDRLAFDASDFAELCETDSAKEGVEAFLDKRFPSQKYGYRLD